MYLYAKDQYESKHQFLIKKRDDVGIKHCNNSKGFIEYSNTIDDIYRDTKDPNKNRKILIVFDGIVVNMISNKKLNPILTKYLLEKKINISLEFITQTYFIK